MNVYFPRSIFKLLKDPSLCPDFFLSVRWERDWGLVGDGEIEHWGKDCREILTSTKCQSEMTIKKSQTFTQTILRS